MVGSKEFNIESSQIMRSNERKTEDKRKEENKEKGHIKIHTVIHLHLTHKTLSFFTLELTFFVLMLIIFTPN